MKGIDTTCTNFCARSLQRSRLVAWRTNFLASDRVHTVMWVGLCLRHHVAVELAIKGNWVCRFIRTGLQDYFAADHCACSDGRTNKIMLPPGLN